MIGGIFNNTKLLEKSLSASWARNEVIADNIANVDTPDYKRKDVSFEDSLRSAMEGNLQGITMDKRHIPINSSNIDDVPVEVTENYSNTSMRLDGNNVDIDAEMAAMAKNTIQYNSLVQSLNASFRRLQTVIK